ncbi:MAG: hypothetical protein ABEH59_10410 [Halobacteriales archaeon]
MELGDMVADVSLTGVSKRVEFRLIGMDDRSLWPDNVYRNRNALGEIGERCVRGEFIGRRVTPWSFYPQTLGVFFRSR